MGFRFLHLGLYFFYSQVVFSRFFLEYVGVCELVLIMFFFYYLRSLVLDFVSSALF